MALACCKVTCRSSPTVLSSQQKVLISGLVGTAALSTSRNPFPVIQCTTALTPSPSKEQNLELYRELSAKRKKVWALPDVKVGGAKLGVRERLRLLGDKGCEPLEIGLLAGLGMDYGDVPCGGNIVCILDVCGEKCVVSASDWTVKGGCSFPITLRKQLRAQEIALQNRLPCIYLIDSGGAFLPLQVSIVLLRFFFFGMSSEFKVQPVIGLELASHF